MGLDRLGADAQAVGDLLVHVPAREVRRTSSSRGVSWSTEVSSAVVVPSSPRKASTRAARRGEKTASPSAARRTASPRSSGEIILVT